jgi:MFS family permease
MNNPKIFSRSLITVSLSYFFFSTSFFLIIVIMSAYAMDNFKATSGEAGLVASVFVFGSLSARLIFGRWIEKGGQKKLFCVGLSLSLVITLLYFVTNNLLLLYGVRFIHGAAFGLTSSVAGTIAANIIPQERRGEGIGYFTLSSTLGVAIGPFLGMFIYHYASYQMVFAASTLAAMLSLVVGVFTFVPETKLTANQAADLKGFKFRNFFEPAAIPISVFVMLMVVCYSSVMTFLTPYAREINLLDSASFFFIVYSVMVFIFRPLIGRLFDLRGANLIMYPGILIFSAGMLMISQSYSGYLLLLSAAILGIANGSIQTNAQVIALQMSPQHRLGLANSTYFMFIDTGVAIGPFLFGMLLPLAGYRTMYAICAIVAFAGIFLYYGLHGRKAANLKMKSRETFR